MTPFIPTPFSQDIAPSSSEGAACVEVCCPGLPLAVYREISAHLRQCTGIDAVVLPQSAETFHYGQSQAGGLRIEYGPDTAQLERQQVQAVLEYYGQRYGGWERIGADSK